MHLVHRRTSLLACISLPPPHSCPQIHPCPRPWQITICSPIRPLNRAITSVTLPLRVHPRTNHRRCITSSLTVTFQSRVKISTSNIPDTEPRTDVIRVLQARVLQQYLVEGGTTSSALNYDFGLVTLASPAPVGTTALRIAAGVGNSVTISLQTAGYPADKPYRTMWEVHVLLGYSLHTLHPPFCPYTVSVSCILTSSSLLRADEFHPEAPGYGFKL